MGKIWLVPRRTRSFIDKSLSGADLIKRYVAGEKFAEDPMFFSSWSDKNTEVGQLINGVVLKKPETLDGVLSAPTADI